MNFLIILLSSLYLCIGFIGLLPIRMKIRYYFFILIFYTFLSLLNENFFNQWLTIPLVFGCCALVYLGCNKEILCLILSLTGYLLLALMNSLFTIPLSLLGISLSEISTQYPIPFLLVSLAFSYIIFWIIRKYFIQPKFLALQSCSKKSLRLFLLVVMLGVSLSIGNFIYGFAVHYPTEVLTMNGTIIAMFCLSAMLLFYNMHGILQQSYELTLQQQEEAHLKDYTTQMEAFYEEMRTFRHDYRNILSSLWYYIDSEDMKSLKEYFQSQIMPSSDLLDHDGFMLGSLRNLQPPALKSLLYCKWIICQNKHLALHFEIPAPISKFPMADSFGFLRILGILLDNAIEAAEQSIEKELRFAFVTTELGTSLSVTNSSPLIEKPISALFQKGYTTKSNHDGIGLSTINDIISPLNNVSLFTNYENGYFYQRLDFSL